MDRESLCPVGARLGRIRVIPVTTSSVAFDLSASTEIASGNGIDGERFLRMRADGCDVYYAFDTVTGTIDRTITTQGVTTQCDLIPNGQYIDVLLPWKPKQGAASGLCLFLMVQGSAAGFLRLSLASEPPATRSL